MSQKFLNPVEVDGQVSAEYLDLSTSTSHSVNAGEIAWNSVDGTFDIGLLNSVTLQVGQEMHFYAKATEAISNSNAVMFAGVQGDHILIAKATPAAINENPEYFMGVATQDFTTNQFGYVTAFGNVRGLNTTGYTLGTVLYFDSNPLSSPGLLTEVKPTAPNAKVEVAAVVRVHATQGILMVRPHTMPKLSDVQDVKITGISTNNIIYWTTSNRWENGSVSTVLGYTPANSSHTHTFDSLTSKTGGTGTYQTSGDFRAPIFYDSNNTGYYVDPASTSVLNGLTLASYSFANNGFQAFKNIGTTTPSWPDANHTLGLRNSDAGHLVLNFHRAGYTSNNLVYDGSFFSFDLSTKSSADFRAPIFYDSDNTGYYIDPASTSQLNHLNIVNIPNNFSIFGGYGSGSGPGLAFENKTTFARMAFWGLDFYEWDAGIVGGINNGYIYANTSFRAPIFYDANNTTYYFDGSSTGDSIRCAGDIVAYYSDERLKDKKGNIENALEKVLSLNGFYYTPNDKAQELGYKYKEEVGVSAQEVEEVLPQIIKDAPIGQGYKTLDYGKLTPLLIEAIKEQQKQIEELKELVNKLITK